MTSIVRIKENQLMSQVIRYGDFIETAGQVSADTTLDIQGQTSQTLAQIDQLLSEVGASRQDLTRVQIWLADISDFTQMNSAYEQWLAGGPKPVRACVGSDLVSGGYLVETQAFAYRKQPSN